MKSARLACFLPIVAVLVAPISLHAETHANLQAVGGSGVSTWSGSYPFTIIGVILNNPEDMLDSTWDPNAETANTMGAEWQLFIQGLSPDFGGTALWMGQNYWSRVPVGDPANRRYNETDWIGEMNRLNFDVGTGHHFRQGDLVEITVNQTLFFGGKRNINEAHSSLPANNFTISLVTADYGLPTAEVLTINDLYASASAPGYDPAYPRFDQTRATGAEHYQGAYVLLTGLTLTDDSGWGKTEWADRLCTVTDGLGNEFTLRMPLCDLGDIPTGEFIAYGIINQESGSSSDGRTGYELFVLSVVPEPACVSLLVVGALALGRRRRT